MLARLRAAHSIRHKIQSEGRLDQVIVFIVGADTAGVRRAEGLYNQLLDYTGSRFKVWRDLGWRDRPGLSIPSKRALRSWSSSVRASPGAHPPGAALAS